ncbi:hypothetical protein A7Y00_14895 [Stenotrophomonas maltophilia]|nr:hypothetical protein A7Y00_14895 [Stenotrophomonas maltophilia]
MQVQGFSLDRAERKHARPCANQRDDVFQVDAVQVAMKRHASALPIHSMLRSRTLQERRDCEVARIMRGARWPA